MDSDLILDLLGNENRRRILRLLSRKPCYVTEISNAIRVAPKAVIEHLVLLEEGGLLESRFDEQRRKYYHISEDLLFEVRLAPSDFGSVLEELDEDEEVPRLWEMLPPDRRPEIPRETASLAEAARALEETRGLQEEVRALQRFLHARAGELSEAMAREAGQLAGDPRDGAVLAAVAKGARTPADIQRESGSPPAEVEAALRRLQERRVVRRRGEGWAVEERV